MGIHHDLAAHAAHSATDSQPGGWSVLATGLFVTALGLAAMTNFRGIADAAGDVMSPGEGAPRPPWQKNPSHGITPDSPAPPAVNVARLIGGVFAFIGLNAIVVGIVNITHGHGHFTIPNTPAIPVPARYFWLAFGAAPIIVAWTPRIFAWRPRMAGYALSAARRNRWQRVASVLATISSAVLVVCVAYGRLAIGIAAWLVSGVIGLVLFLVQRHPHHFIPTVRNDGPTARLARPRRCICGETHALVFTTKNGRPIELRNINRAFDIRCRRAGVRRITIHDTRRTCGSLLAALDVHPRVAMAILRQSRIALTMEIYTQIPDKTTRDALKWLSDWLGQGDDEPGPHGAEGG